MRDLENLSESESDPEQILRKEFDEQASGSERSWQGNEEGLAQLPELKFSKLRTDSKFNDLLARIKNDSFQNRQQVMSIINEINEYLRMITPEIMAVHKTARDGFMARFPELESIILVPADYCKVVLAIGNES